MILLSSGFRSTGKEHTVQDMDSQLLSTDSETRIHSSGKRNSKESSYGGVVLLGSVLSYWPFSCYALPPCTTLLLQRSFRRLHYFSCCIHVYSESGILWQTNNSVATRRGCMHGTVPWWYFLISLALAGTILEKSASDHCEINETNLQLHPRDIRCNTCCQDH